MPTDYQLMFEIVGAGAGCREDRKLQALKGMPVKEGEINGIEATVIVGCVNLASAVSTSRTTSLF